MEIKNKKFKKNQLNSKKKMVRVRNKNRQQLIEKFIIENLYLNAKIS
jgi:hypothetical protein